MASRSSQHGEERQHGSENGCSNRNGGRKKEHNAIGALQGFIYQHLMDESYKLDERQHEADL